MFTLEIGGRPVAVTDADEAEAREIFGSEEFRQDLLVMTSDGAPLWDGTSPMTIRPSSSQEAAAFESPEVELEDEGTSEAGGAEAFVTFIVPIDRDHEEISDVPPELQG